MGPWSHVSRLLLDPDECAGVAESPQFLSQEVFAHGIELFHAHYGNVFPLLPLSLLRQFVVQFTRTDEHGSRFFRV